MVRPLHSNASPRAEWLERCAARLLNSSPDLRPLDAVRRAMSAFADAGSLDPDLAARQMLVADLPHAGTRLSSLTDSPLPPATAAAAPPPAA